MNEKFKIIPSVDFILSLAEANKSLKSYNRDFLRDKCRHSLEFYRTRIGREKFFFKTKEEVAEYVLSLMIKDIVNEFSPHLKPVINATGIVLHTGLGRAPLSSRAQENVKNVMEGYASLEIDLESGKRGERTDHVRSLLTQLTGAEDALVVNNNAAAVFLALNTMAFGKEAIISRGQLIEIGGSFRMPDIMEKSGVKMREVGTTNKTKLSDYQNAITEDTGLIVVAHTSNYRVLGFTAEVQLKDLCELAHSHNIPVLHDLGAGVIVDLQQYGLPYEPLVQDSLLAGVDVVTFSGDKVLGGPQSGLIVGKKQWLDKIHKNPIMRAVRCDKLIYAALEETLRLFFKKNIKREHKTLSLLTVSQKELLKRANAIYKNINKDVIRMLDIRVEKSYGQIGSGALPLENIASVALVLHSKAVSSEDIAKKLRTGDPPVIGYIRDNCVHLDVRTVGKNEEKDLIHRINSLTDIEKNK